MTIVVGVVAPDGIILAADSRTTWVGDDGRHRFLSDSSVKLFELCEQFGVATYGLAFIAEKTIAGVMNEFVAQLPDLEEDEERDIYDIAEALGEFFDERVTAWAEDSGEELPDAWLLGFLVAGYDADGIGHIIEVGVPSGDFGEYSPNTAERGVMWRGQTDVIRRLIKGVARDELLASGVEVSDELDEQLSQLEYSLMLPISMQDAADFAVFLVKTTIDMQRFSDGTLGAPGLVPACGGAVRLLAVSGSAVEWVSDQPLIGPTRTGMAEGSA